MEEEKDLEKEKKIEKKGDKRRIASGAFPYVCLRRN